MPAFYFPSLAQQIPAGTVLPVMMSTTIDSARLKPGDRVKGKLMQNVVLPSGETIRAGAKLGGQVTQAAPGPNARVDIRFDKLTAARKEYILRVRLRALASMEEVFAAQLPVGTFDEYGTSISDWTTVQIGGAAVYLGDATVRSGMEIVGRAPAYGEVLAKLEPAPKWGCPAEAMVMSNEQALWLFSPWACGIYGLDDLSIGQPNAETPFGTVVLTAPKAVRVRAGSGWLLEAVETADLPQASAKN